MKIDTRGLTNCSVIEGGERISLGMVDERGEALELKVSTSDACAIAMTLPKLLNLSMKEKFQDDRLRYVFPLDDWKVETTSDGKQAVVTLATGEGYEVSFASRPGTCRLLGSALAAPLERRMARSATKVN
jgi:hypothetical protein